MTDDDAPLMDEEARAAYGRLSIEDRLRWLSDALAFEQMVFTPQERAHRERMKRRLFYGE